MRVFVNGVAGEAPSGVTVLDAVRLVDPVEAGEVEAGRRAIVDSRGLPTDPAALTFAGAIYRTVRAKSPSASE